MTGVNRKIHRKVNPTSGIILEHAYQFPRSYAAISPGEIHLRERYDQLEGSGSGSACSEPTYTGVPDDTQEKFSASR